MNSELIIGAPPEEEDLNRLRQKIGRLAELLAARELELTETRLALTRFEARYYQQVGRLYARLDALKASLAELRARLAPRDPWLDRQARQARSSAERTAREYKAFGQQPPPAEPELEIPAETKKLYRRIAAEIHPDKAVDEQSRDLRTRLMAELNAAYARGDREGMEEILHNWQSSPETVTGHDAAAELTRLQRTLERLQNKVGTIDQDLQRLRNSELHVLMTSARQAERQGRDLLRELAQTIEQQIEQARRELAGLSGDQNHV